MSLLFGRKRKIPTPNSPSTLTDVIGSDRLRKAIERNRAKQVRRTGVPASPSGFKRPMPPREDPYREEDRYQRQEFNRPSPPSSPSSYGRPTPTGYERPQAPRPMAPMGTRPTAPMGTRPTAPMGTRPASPPPVSRPMPGSTTTPTRSPYSSPTTKAPSKWAKYFLRGLWLFSIFLLLRLVFTERGVMEYYGRTGTLKDKYESLSQIKKGNIELEKEIKKIRKDSAYQKALVRNHLGFIAGDEFIVLLPD